MVLGLGWLLSYISLNFGNGEMKTDDVIKLVKTLTRPILTGIGLIAWIAFLGFHYDIPPQFTALVWGMIAWWFGDRTYFKRKVVNNGGYDIAKLI